MGSFPCFNNVFWEDLIEALRKQVAKLIPFETVTDRHEGRFNAAQSDLLQDTCEHICKKESRMWQVYRSRHNAKFLLTMARNLYYSQIKKDNRRHDLLKEHIETDVYTPRTYSKNPNAIHTTDRKTMLADGRNETFISASADHTPETWIAIDQDETAQAERFCTLQKRLHEILTAEEYDVYWRYIVEEKSYRQIAPEIGKSYSRVRQIYKKTELKIEGDLNIDI